ncbi:MAG: RIP metalloprotease RseP [Synergistaceae bacterium]|jgi:regulator of sigma E protease|nr:RIP metalloprotease RseP [Synergistaceae bacterium]
MVSLLSFLLVIAVCVLIHEGGHYAAAVWRNVQVHEFAFGMGPGIITKRLAGGTLWSWRLFPIGGFVRLEGDENELRPGDIPDQARSFNVKRPWERFVIIAGGATMNILLAWLLTALLLSGNGINDIESPVVGNLMPGYPAASMGALPGDRVVSINGLPISAWPEIRKTLQTLETDDVSIVVRRGDSEMTLSGVVPASGDQGVRLWGVQPSRIRYPFYKALFVGMSYCWRMSVDILKGLWMMLTGEMAADVAGPVGIAVMAGDAARQGFWTFITFMAVINLNLGILNLFPLPALDGGRLVFLLGEMLSGRRFPERWENRIHLVGFVLLLVLIALVTWKDILRLAG